MGRWPGAICPDAVWILVTIALVLPLGPLLYRIAFRPIADAPVLVLLIVSVVLHFAISGVALIFFGPESARPRAAGRCRSSPSAADRDRAATADARRCPRCIALLLFLFFGRTRSPARRCARPR